MWSAGAHTWIPAIACHGWWELMAWAVCQGERQRRGSPCRWLSKGQVGEAPPCLGVPGATGNFWYIYLWRRDMCFGNLKVLAIQSCPTLCDPMDCNLPGSSVHGILLARILEWIASHSLLQGIFLTQGLNPGLLHCRQILCHLSRQ